MSAVAISVRNARQVSQVNECVCTIPVSVCLLPHVFVLVLANSKEMNLKCQMGYWSESPIGPLLSAPAQTQWKLLEQVRDNWGTKQTSSFISKRQGMCVRVHVCACAGVGWGICITDEYRTGWCETVSSRGAQGEMQCPCWETLQSYLPPSHCVSPTFYFHLSFPTFWMRSYLSSPSLSYTCAPSPPPTLPCRLAASSISSLHPLKMGSVFDVFIFRRWLGASALRVPY